MYIHAEHMGKQFLCTLSIQGNDLNAGWKYEEMILRTLGYAENEEMILSHPGQTRKYIKVEYVSQIEYDFQKSQVTGSWDHKVSVSAKSKKTLLVYL